MSKLYEKVQNIINADSMEEAENLLYGKDGIQIDTKEHYQRIISNFIKKKELIISKNGNEIYFDLDQNISDAWDMIFISEYIQKQIEDEIEELTKEAQRLKSAKASKDEIDKIRQAKNELSNSLASIRKISDLNRITVNSFKPHDNIKAEITKLKEAINVIEKIRGSFEHQDIYGNNNSVTVDKAVVINNPKVKLNVKIPIEYLDGFTKGRIIAREEDKIVLEKTNNIVSPILKELGYDISKIESFFYNVDPDVLSYLLDYLDNDITKLYELPLSLFTSSYSFEDNRQKQLSRIYLLQKIKYKEAFIRNIKNIQSFMFNNPESTIALINNLPFGEKNIDFVSILPDVAFINPKIIIDFVSKLSIEEQKIIGDNLISIKELYDSIFNNKSNGMRVPTFLKPIIMQLNEKEIRPEGQILLPFILLLNRKGIRKKLEEMIGSKFSLATDSRLYMFMNRYPEQLFYFLNKMPFKIEANIRILEAIPVEAISYPTGVTEIINGLNLDTNGNISILSKLPKEAFKYSNSSLLFLDELSSQRDRWLRLLNNIPSEAYKKANNTQLLLRKLPDGNGNAINLLEIFPQNIFESRWDLSKAEAIIDNAKGIVEAVDFLPYTTEIKYDIIRMLPGTALKESIECLFRLVTELPYSEKNYEIIKQLPPECFTQEPEYIIKLFNEFPNQIDENILKIKTHSKLLYSLDIDYVKQLPFDMNTNIHILNNLYNVRDKMDNIVKLINGLPFDGKTMSRLLSSSKNKLDIFNHPDEVIKLVRELPFKPLDNFWIIRANPAILKEDIDSIIETFKDGYTPYLERYIKFWSSPTAYTQTINTHNALEEASINEDKLSDDILYFFFNSCYEPITYKELKKEEKNDIEIENELYMSNVMFKPNHSRHREVIFENAKMIKHKYKIDEEKFDELPKVLFTCDPDIMDVMLQRYNSNIARSIFGINNPKIISLLIYMNNVFSGYNVNNTVDIDMTDYIVEAYEPSDFLKDTLKDTIAYRNNISDVEMDPVKFFEQFGYGPSKDAIVNTFLEKMRNASCHFRIKPVRDRNGNLIEDKVYIFDEDNYGNNNFNIILDIDVALELTRKVEIALKKSLDKDDDDPIKSKKAP